MVEDLLTLLTDNKQITILISLIGTLYWLWQKVRKELNEKKRELMSDILTTQTSVDSFKAEIEQKLTHSPNLYKEELTKVLGFLEKYLEPLKLLSSKAFEKHFIFSLIYSFLFFYLVWLFGGDGKVGEHQFIPNENRLGISLYLIFEIVTLYFLFAYAGKLQKSPWFSRLNNIWAELLVVVTVVGVVVVGVGGVAVAVVGREVAVGGIGVLLVGVVGAVIVAGAGAGVGVGVGVAAVVGAVAVGAVGAVAGGVDSTNILYLLFFFILPFINAIFDYLSMIASRFFAQKILQTHKKLTIFWDILWDLLIASLLFVGLAFTLFYLLDFSNHAFIKDEALFIPIEHYKSLLLSGNIFHPDVLWITLMFVSTLIPTFIHLYLFLYSLMAFVMVQPHLHQVVDALEKLDLENQHQKELVAYDLADYRLTNYLRIHIGLMVMLSLVFVVVLGVVISKMDFGFGGF